MPLHTIIEIQMGVSGVQEKRYKLMDWIQTTTITTNPNNSQSLKVFILLYSAIYHWVAFW